MDVFAYVGGNVFNWCDLPMQNVSCACLMLQESSYVPRAVHHSNTATSFSSVRKDTQPTVSQELFAGVGRDLGQAIDLTQSDSISNRLCRAR